MPPLHAILRQHTRAAHLLGGALALGLLGPAQGADTRPYAARTQRAPLMVEDFLVAGQPWHCQTALRRCEGNLPALLTPEQACTRVAAWVGALSEFGGPAGDLPPAALARCNRAAGLQHPSSRP